MYINLLLILLNFYIRKKYFFYISNDLLNHLRKNITIFKLMKYICTLFSIIEQRNKIQGYVSKQTAFDFFN